MPLTKITTGAITDAAVTEDKLGSSAVTEAKIGSSAVTEAKIGSSAVTSAKISDGTIANADISPSANIAESKLSVGDLSSKVARNESNIGILGFKMAVNEGLTVFNLVDGIVDEFNDQSGISTPQNSNQSYCATGDFYTNSVTCDSVPATQELTNYTASGVGPTGTTSGTFTADPAAVAYNVLIVGGGGGSGTDAGGGGGAGGLVYIPHYPVTAGASYPYQSGTGGYGTRADPSVVNAVDGTNSEFNEIIALGGGAGGGRSPGGERAGNDGGSGGGSTEPTPGTSAGLQPQQSGDAGTYGFGNGGGSSPGGSHGAGGGGAGGAGQPAPSPDGGGNGGNGRDYTILDGSSTVEYAAGGGGGSGSGAAGAAGGPSSGAGSNAGNGANATASRGGGGGGGTNIPSGKGGSGGPGIVALQLSKTSSMQTTTTLTSAPFGVADSSVPTTARIVLFAEFNDTTETLNTDVIAKVSRDNGANYTNVTLSDAGYVAGTSGQKIYTGTVDVSGQPSGNEMRYQLAGANLSTEVKIHGVALQWT